MSEAINVVSPVPKPMSVSALKMFWNEGAFPADRTREESKFEKNCLVNIMDIYNIVIDQFLLTCKNKVEIKFYLNPDFYDVKNTEKIVMETIMDSVKELFPGFTVECVPSHVQHSNWITAMNGSYIEYYKISVGFNDGE